MFCSEDLYVGAFLRKEPAEAGTEDQSVEASSLHEVGTFAHVHTIHHASGAAHGGGAMVLLVGHRRIKQTKQVSMQCLLCCVLLLLYFAILGLQRCPGAFKTPDEGQTLGAVKNGHLRDQIANMYMYIPWTCCLQ